MRRCFGSRCPARAQNSNVAWSDEVKGSNKEILKTVMNESEKTIHSYMKKLHAKSAVCAVFGLYGED